MMHFFTFDPHLWLCRGDMSGFGNQAVLSCKAGFEGGSSLFFLSKIVSLCLSKHHVFSSCLFFLQVTEAPPAV